MSNISANITELKQLLEATPASHNIMLVGNHGIGKSEILTVSFYNSVKLLDNDKSLYLCGKVRNKLFR